MIVATEVLGSLRSSKLSSCFPFVDCHFVDCQMRIRDLKRTEPFRSHHFGPGACQLTCPGFLLLASSTPLYLLATWSSLHL